MTDLPRVTEMKHRPYATELKRIVDLLDTLDEATARAFLQNVIHDLQDEFDLDEGNRENAESSESNSSPADTMEEFGIARVDR